MGTEVECRSLAELLRLVERIDEALVADGAKRITIQLKIDHRIDRAATLQDKVRSALGNPSTPHQ
jgi:uncharacterized protein YqgV (UPF0045/DUF77 family)